MPNQYRIRSAFDSPQDASTGLGKRPVVFDILGPDRQTSLLPEYLKMVLHVNPSTLSFSYSKVIERTQTQGGFVEFHWGVSPGEVSINAATGGFIRLNSGLSNVTGPTPSNSAIRPTTMQARDLGGTRRDSIAYDKYLDLLALFKNNGAIYDSNGNIAFQGQIVMAFDGSVWYGWFTSFSVEESAEKPYQFDLTANFIIDREKHTLRSMTIPPSDTGNT
jgi:hypothetical protein